MGSDSIHTLGTIRVPPLDVATEDAGPKTREAKGKHLPLASLFGLRSLRLYLFPQPGALSDLCPARDNRNPLNSSFLNNLALLAIKKDAYLASHRYKMGKVKQAPRGLVWRNPASVNRVTYIGPTECVATYP